jgi:large subunit ribosomal protein L17
MRHLRTVSKLSRPKSHRRALLMNMANSLFQHESIKTTDTKAMELKRVADKLITLAKRKDLHSMRLVFAFLRDKAVVKKLFADIGDRYLSINGGYTRVLKIGRRKGDAAPMAIIELTQKREPEEKAKKETKEQPKKEAKEKPKKEKAAGKETKKEKPKKEAKEKPEKEAKAKPKRAKKAKEEGEEQA